MGIIAGKTFNIGFYVYAVFFAILGKIRDIKFAVITTFRIGYIAPMPIVVYWLFIKRNYNSIVLYFFKSLRKHSGMSAPKAS